MADANRGSVKGVLLVNLRDYVTERRGADGWAQLQSRQKGPDRDVWSGITLSGSWYPVGAWNRALHAFFGEQPDTDAAMREFARFVSERDLHAVFRILLRITSPEFVLGRLRSVWTRYFDSGRFASTERGTRRWEVTIDAPTDEDAAPGPLACVGVGGWIEQALALTGTRGGRVVETRCRFHGAPSCLHEVTW